MMNLSERMWEEKKGAKAVSCSDTKRITIAITKTKTVQRGRAVE